MSNKPQLQPSGKISPMTALWFLGGCLFMAILLIFMLNRNEESLADCNYLYPGDSGRIELNPGDSLCIPSGSLFTGTIASFPPGSKITVEAEAIFRPSSTSILAGLFVNNGASFMPTASLGGGFQLINNDTLSFEDGLILSGTVDISNTSEGRITFVYPLNFNRSSSIENWGIIYAGSNLEFADSTTITNNGYLLGSGSMEFMSSVENDGMISAVGRITLSGNSRMDNNCSILSIEGFTNDNPNTENAGLIIVNGSGGFPNDLIEINQNFNNQSQGYVAGIRFVNNASITGSGDFYFAGDTENNGPFGTDGNGINFYDDSSPSNIMDVENTNPDASVFRDASRIPDSFFIPPGCDVSFLPSFLPVEWQDISVSFEDGASLIQWSTSQEINHDRFEVERSLDGEQFDYLSGVKNPTSEEGNTRSYQYKDYGIQLNESQTIYYRIRQVDIDGRSSLSQVMSLSMVSGGLPLEFHLSNPVMNGQLSMTISSKEALDGELSILNLQGQKIHGSPLRINPGRNSRGIHLQTIPSGMYVVELKAGGKKMSKRVIFHNY